MTSDWRGESKRKWWTLVLIVLLLHAAALLFVRPEYFDFLLRDSKSPSGAAHRARAASMPDAIIAIQVDVEDSESEIPEQPVTEPSRPAPPSPEQDANLPGEDAEALQTVDLGDLLGQASSPRAGGGTRLNETIPPRPVEITWPETRRLKHCIGRHVDVRIRVAADGTIREVVPDASDIAPDCLRAALDAAGRIKFAPGKVNGTPSELWAQVRIDFEEKR
ncbi:MAG TPA: energy transducer TonB [Candidatus Krumholzibacteria bacterium]|nr:energy transducer TonB [Candidatus Krumholzibacteria bacterium]